MCNTCGCGYYNPTYPSGQYCSTCGVWFSGVHSCTALKNVTNQYDTVVSVGYEPVLSRIADALEKIAAQPRVGPDGTPTHCHTCGLLLAKHCGNCERKAADSEQRTACTCELCISPKNETAWDRFGEYKPDQG